MNTIELNKVICYLQEQEDPKSKAQLDVLEHKLKESQVFRKYVVEKNRDERDEEIYFAARDASEYLAGKIDLAAFLPDVTMDEIEKVACNGTVTLSFEEYNSILNRLERIETRLSLSAYTNKLPSKTIKGKIEGDLISQKEVLEYIGYSRTTLLRWVEKGLVTRYRKVRTSYYSKAEIDKAKELADYNRH